MKKIAFSLLALIVVIVFGLYFFAKSTTTNYNFTINSSEVEHNVRVVFDDNAVPHIYADSEIDAMFALGYVHASERLWQMDLIRHVGEGSLSELFGKDMLDNDRFLRTIGIDKEARKSEKEFILNAPKDVKDASFAYLKGINKFIDEDKLPLEYSILQLTPKHFSVVDFYRATGYMAYSFALGLKTDPLVTWFKANLDDEHYRELEIHQKKNNTKIPVTNNDFSAIAESIAILDDKLPVPQFIGSNAWVIAPKKTQSGKVVFANDAHIAFASPSVWYEAHIITPELEYYGNHLAGFPFPLIGHTRTQSWGITMFENDDIDLYQEKIEGSKYLVDDSWKNINERKEELKIKGEKSEELIVIETEHGPIINSVLPSLKKSEPIAMWWIYNQYKDNKLLEAAYKFSRSSTMDEVRQGASMIHAPGLNIMYGDSSGNIAWWASAKLPVRHDNLDSKIIVDGSKSENNITDWYDFSKNPQAINPESGYVYSANNAPDMVDSVYYEGYYYNGNTRARGIINALESKQTGWSIKDVEDLQMNGISLTYKNNIELMIAAVDATKFLDSELEILNELSKWEGTHGVNEIAPTIYYKWMYTALKLTFADELGEDKFKALMNSNIWANTFPLLLQNPKSVWFDDVRTEKIENLGEIATKSLKYSLSSLVEQFGIKHKDWKWGNVHTVTFNHPLGKVKPLNYIFNVGPYSVGSGKDAINKLSFKLDGSGIYNVTSGPSMRIALDFADIENSESIIPTGQSGNIMSDFYSNQAQKYVNGIYRKQRMNKKDIEANKTGESMFIAN